MIRRLHEYAVIAVAFALALEVPLRSAFGTPGYGGGMLLVWEFCATAILLGDVLANFFTPFHEHHHLIRDRRRIAARYLRGWFAIDLLAALPLALLAEAAGAEAGPAALIGLHRLVKIARLPSAGRIWRDRHLQWLHPGAFRLALFVVFVGVFAHWTACGWLWLDGIPARVTRIDTYVEALYWTITTLTTVGYGDITPASTPQRIYTMLVMIAGVGSYGYLIANMASFLANLDTVRAEQAHKLDEVSSFLRYRDIPPELRRRVMDYYGHLWESDSGPNERQLLDELPEPLRTDMALVMHRTLLRNVPLFRDAQTALLKEIVLLLRPELVPPGTTFIHEGEAGDCMYFISSGTVEVVSADGQRVHATLEDGDYVGELALVLDRPRSASVRTRGYCDLYVLTRRDFERVLAAHPEFRTHIAETVERRARKIRERENGGSEAREP